MHVRRSHQTRRLRDLSVNMRRCQEIAAAFFVLIAIIPIILVRPLSMSVCSLMLAILVMNRFVSVIMGIPWRTHRGRVMPVIVMLWGVMPLQVFPVTVSARMLEMMTR